jgi:phospholipase/carboxylesterase
MRLMTADNLSLQHLVRPPRGVSPGKPPLLLLLHGIGSHEHDLFGMASALDGRFFVVSARAPIEMMPGGYGWFNIEFTQAGTIVPDLEQAEASSLLLVKFIDELVDAYGVDPNCVYLMGFSQGAMMSLSIALTNPVKVARVVAMSGRLADQAVLHKGPLEEIKKLEMFVTHGTFDNVLPVQFGRACRDELEKLGVPLTYREYPMAHEVTMDALRDVTAWLKSTLDKGC